MKHMVANLAEANSREGIAPAQSREPREVGIGRVQLGLTFDRQGDAFGHVTLERQGRAHADIRMSAY